MEYILSHSTHETDVNPLAKGWANHVTPLQLAAAGTSNGHVKIVKMIVAHISPPQDIEEFLKWDYVTFEMAAQGGNLEIFKIIAEAFGNIINPSNHYNENQTPLHVAASHAQFEVCKYILQNVYYKHSKNRQRMTPLDLAKSCKNTKIVQLIEFYSRIRNRHTQR